MDELRAFCKTFKNLPAVNMKLKYNVIKLISEFVLKFSCQTDGEDISNVETFKN